MKPLSRRAILLTTAITIISIVAVAYTGVLTTQLLQSPVVKRIAQVMTLYSKHHLQDRLYIATDKPFYKPDETVWYSVQLRDAETLLPSHESDIVHIDFINPKGNAIKRYKLIAKDGIATGDIDLSGELGGIYKIKAYTEYQKNEDFAFVMEKEITIQSVVIPRLKMKIDWEKKAYGKGDIATADLTIQTNTNKPLANTAIKYAIQIQGKLLNTFTATTTDSGKAKVTFTLPNDITTPDGIVNVMIDYEGSTESISRSIPIVLNQIALDLMPEGGDMIYGVHSRVAFRARNEFGKPADIAGNITNEKGEIVAQFTTYHQGMGAVEMTPIAGHTYTAHITQPIGITDSYALPNPLDNGYLIAANPTHDAIDARVYSFRAEQLHIVAQTRGKLYYSTTLNALKGDNRLHISTTTFPIGVSQLTLFDSRGIARSERLVFVNRDKKLKIAITPDKPLYHPRELAVLNIRATDEQGLPVSGAFSLSVVDDNLLSYADDKQGNILSKILLEPDLKEKVDEPAFYFDEKEAKSLPALDYLMLTCGWRRYSWKQIFNSDTNAAKYPGERATLAGTVMYDYPQRTTIKGAKIKLLPSGRTVTTDRNGHYDLGRFDITIDNKIEISGDSFPTTSVIIKEYSTNKVLYVSGAGVMYIVNGHREFIEKAVPMMARGGQANVQYAAPYHDLKDKAGVGVENIDIMGAMMDEAPIKRDVAPLPIKDNTKEEATTVGDLRDASTKAADRKAVANNAVTYYRAKEFPKKVYRKEDIDRTDFATTLYWNGRVETDQNGKAKVSFMTTDLVSSFRISAEGFGDEGSIGRGEAVFAVNMPFSMDMKLPTILTDGDQVTVPIFLKNNTDKEVKGSIDIPAIPALRATATIEHEVRIPAHDSRIMYLPYAAVHTDSTYSLAVSFVGGDIHDLMVRPIRVNAKGFPANISLSGQDLSKKFTINPRNVVSGSMHVTFTAYPSVMTELMSGVDGILREPNGCFEQTSSTNYPNVMALDYMRSMKVNNPEWEKHAMELLDKGYAKLTSFETSEKGYEWFGAAPAHEALTAYGLMEFQDMKKVYPRVSQEMIGRTRDKLLAARDGKGGFKRNSKQIDNFGRADEDITNAYIVYALSESGYKDIVKELDASIYDAHKTKDPYLMALVANALFNIGDVKRGDEMVHDIADRKNQYGYWTGLRHSITHSTGDGLNIETSSLVALAAMKSPTPDLSVITAAIKYLVGTRSGFGNFGSTQSTVLALKALTKYAEYSRKTDEAGTIEIYQDGKLMVSKAYAKGEKQNIVIDGIEKYMTEGKHEIEVKYMGCKSALPYSMNVQYATALPVSDPNCVLTLQSTIDVSKAVKVGETIRYTTTLHNTTHTGQPMSMMMVGIPAGMTAQPWQLRELQEKKVFDFYEVIDNNVAIYYRDLAPDAVRTVSLDLKAELPGTYTAPASAAYLYYTNEHKVWAATPPIQVVQ